VAYCAKPRDWADHADGWQYIRYDSTQDVHLQILMHVHPAVHHGTGRDGPVPLGDLSCVPPQKGHYVDLEAQNGTMNAAPSGVIWRKSRHSNPSGNCVEIAELPDGMVAIRNSRHPSGPALICAPAEFSAFLAAAREGEFDGLLD
jgi:hypothetical protein